jgi:hypothetical protein
MRIIQYVDINNPGGLNYKNVMVVIDFCSKLECLSLEPPRIELCEGFHSKDKLQAKPRPNFIKNHHKYNKLQY